MTALRFDPTVNASFGIPASLSDASCRRLAVSDRYAELLMRPNEGLLKESWQSHAHPDDFQALALPVCQLVARGEPFEQKCRVRRGDGTWLNLIYRVVQGYDRRSGRLIIQTNVKVEDSAPKSKPVIPAAEPAALAEYIREMTKELGQIAGQKNMTLLRNLLFAASAEAGQESERLAEVARLLNEMHRILH